MGTKDPERHKRLESVFLGAESLPPDEQRAFVDRELADDPELHDRVVEMLGTDEAIDSIISFAPARPERIGPYEIVEEIGRGGMGAVFRAIQPTTKRVVALKLVRTEMMGEALVRRFSREVEVLGQLQHPNIAQVYEGGEARVPSGTVPYFVMELVPNAKPIDRFVRDAGLDLTATLGLFLQLCSAIEYAHRMGVIHRDLKPENVLVDANSAEPRPKVIDFGIARVSGAGANATAMTTTGQIIGTFESMSPEQARGATDEIDVRTDVYSLGVVLYQMLTGAPPIPTRSLSIADAVRAILEDPPAAPSKLRAGIRPELDAIVFMCLEKEQDRRYETVRALLEDVEALLDGRTVSAKSPTTIDVVRRTVRRHRAIVIPVAIVFVVAVVAAVVSTRFAIRANDRELETREHAERLSRVAYQSNLGAAAVALEAADARGAERSLALAPKEHRGWEWAHLSSRLPRPVREFELTSPASTVNLDFTPDGSQFLTTSQSDSAVCVWSSSTGELQHRVSIGATPSWAQFDGSGSIFARSGNTLSIRMYRVSLDGSTRDSWVSEAVQRSGWADGVEAGDDGFITTISKTGDGTVYDLRARAVKFSRPLRRKRSWLKFDQARDRLVVGGDNLDRTWTFEVIDITGTRPTLIIPNVQIVVRAVELGPLGRYLAVGDSNGRLRVWDLDRGPNELHTFSLPEAPTVIEFSPDGRVLAAVAIDNKLRWWNVASGELLGTIGGFKTQVMMMRFQPGSNLLYTVCDEGTVQVWDLSGESNVLTQHASYVYAVEAGRGDLVLSGGWDGHANQSGCLRWTDIETGEEIGSIGPPGMFVTELVISPDGTEALVSIVGPAVNLRISESAKKFWPEDDQALAAFDPEDTHLIRVSMVTGRVLATLDFPRDPQGRPGRVVGHLAIDPLLERAAVAWVNGGNSVFELASGNILHEDVHSGQVSALPHMGGAGIAWSADGRWIAAAVTSSRIEIWNADTYELVTVLSGHDQLIRSVAFDPAGERLVTTSNDQRVKVWSVSEGELLAELTGHGADVLCAKFNPAGTRIVSGGRGGTAWVWGTDPYEPLVELLLHDSYIYSLDWSDDGERLLTASGDGTVRMWDHGRQGARSIARSERAEMVARVTPAIESALSSGLNIEQVWHSMVAESDRAPREKNVIWQELLRRSISLKKG